MIKNIIIVILTILLIASLVLTVFIYKEYLDKVDQVNSYVSKLSLEAWQKAQDQLNKFKVTWPTKGARLCFEQLYSVNWEAPLGMEVVSTSLYSPTSSLTPSTRYDLGSHPAINSNGENKGYGSFSWDLTDVNGSIIPAGDIYKISISGMYNNQVISTSSEGVFSIGNCGR